MPSASADRIVRLAWAADAAGIGAVQTAAWTGPYARLLPPQVVSAIDASEHSLAWEQALRRAPSARHRVLVALEANSVVGFAALCPSEDPDADPIADAELTAVHVDPDHTRRGHGSRLIAAAVDTARADGFATLRSWLFAEDDELRRFLQAGGWAADSAHRTLDLLGDGMALRRQVRLHTSLR